MERFTADFLMARSSGFNDRAILRELPGGPAPCAACGIELHHHCLTTDGEPVCWPCTTRLEVDFPGAVDFHRRS